MQLIIDSAGCKVTLRKASLYVSCFFLSLNLLSVIANPSLLSHKMSLLAIILEVVPNVALLFGALRDNKWLVLVWLMKAALFFIGWPIGLLGVIFNFGGYRQIAMAANFFAFIVAYILVLVIYAYFSRIVFSYFHQLLNTKTMRQQPVVV